MGNILCNNCVRKNVKQQSPKSCCDRLKLPISKRDRDRDIEMKVVKNYLGYN